MFLCPYANTDKEIIIVCVLNFHLDIPTNRDTITFTSIIESCGMKQSVNEPTHVRGHTFDIVKTRDNSNISSTIVDVGPVLCDYQVNIQQDHFAATFSAKLSKLPPIKKTATYRKLRSIDMRVFKQDMVQYELFIINVWVMSITFIS